MSGVDTIISLEYADFLIRALGISVIVGALVFRFFYVQLHWKLRTESEAKARLEALQARIRPHFLFNCMNTIAGVTRTDLRAAERAVEDLADLFRANIGVGRNLAPFDEEFELVRDHLNIETLRLHSRLNMVIETAHHLARLTNAPAVIFTTAYDEHALAAFEANAIDYLLKPIRSRRLQQALQKARALTDAQTHGVALPDGDGRTHVSGLVHGDLALVGIERVFYFQAGQGYVEVVWDGGSMFIEESLRSL